MIDHYATAIIRHLEAAWNNVATERRWTAGPMGDLSSAFRILEFPPSVHRALWTYATCCMSSPTDEQRLELHLFSPEQSDAHVELFTAIAHYHRTGSTVGLNHTVDFGRPWMPNSRCTHGLISLPYLDGPRLEWLHDAPGGGSVRVLWLIPITPEELAYALKNGVAAIESKLEASGFNYADPDRPSVV